jgi:hypothetical protein
LSGGRLIVAKEGASALLTGFGPTAVGYLIQGGAKFAGYEFWKTTFVTVAGDQETAVKYRTAIYLGAASVGESVSCDLNMSYYRCANLPWLANPRTPAPRRAFLDSSLIFS